VGRLSDPFSALDSVERADSCLIADRKTEGPLEDVGTGDPDREKAQSMQKGTSSRRSFAASRPSA